jgi:hypothetical protein
MAAGRSARTKVGHRKTGIPASPGEEPIRPACLERWPAVQLRPEAVHNRGRVTGAVNRMAGCAYPTGSEGKEKLGTFGKNDKWARFGPMKATGAGQLDPLRIGFVL